MIKNISIGIVALIVGSFIGFKVTESMGREYIMNNLPIPEGTLDDKDVFIESVPAGSVLIPKSLAAVERKAKNIILLIGDGMSASQVSSYRLLKGGPNARLAVDKFPISGIVLTHSEDAIVTDSASSATAYSTGIKTNNTFLGLDKDKNVLKNLTEKIHGYGFVSSLIATSEVTHATPAAFAAHIDLRWKTDEISAQMMDSNVVTILGGGRHFFLTEEMGGKREDGRDLLQEVENSHVLLTHKDQLNDFDQTTSGKVVGLFADEHLRDLEKPENHSTEPSLSEMLNFAIKRSETFMDNGCKGSFIMVEGSQVDWAGHSNDINYLKREMQDLEEAVELAVDYANKNQDTLVIVTADHETGGLLIEPASAADYTGNEVKFSFNTAIGRGSHTGVPVPVYAYGPGSENFTGTLDNTDVYRAMIAALDLTEESGSCLGN
jgi:alkaline phosphatase|tara:strand:+ start:1323 stop:2627 length:1305 start_codon:yes stop_codon:yes gene_type:complete